MPAEPAVAADDASQDAPRRSYFSQSGGAAPAPAPVAPAPAAVLPEASATAAAPVPAAAPAQPVVATAAVAAVDTAAPAPVQAPAPTAVKPAAPVQPAQAPASVAAAAAPGLPRVQAFALPIDELNRIAEGSGLQWVNSDAEKIAAAQAAIAAEPRPVHVPRERPPVVVLDEGPLVLVETRRDLRDLKLPFEEQPSSAA